MDQGGFVGSAGRLQLGTVRNMNFEDQRSNVRIEFLVTGEYPSDGKPKPGRFPTPPTKSTAFVTYALGNTLS